MKKTEKIVFTNGCFDIIHSGHIHLLKQAKKMGDKLIVGLNSDTSVKKIKGPDRPINSQENRLTVLKAIKFVDEVIIFEETDPLNLIIKIKPDVLVKGSDYPIDKVIGNDFVNSYGGRVVLVDLIPNQSSTRIINETIDR